MSSGQEISRVTLNNMGRRCPPKTTTTSTTEAALKIGCDKEAFEQESNAKLTCTSGNVTFQLR